MLVVVVLKGLPGSGKTTWARARLARRPGRYKRVNKDDLRVMLDGGRYSPANERFVEAVRDVVVLAALDAGRSVIVDDTNLDPRHEAHLRRLVADRAAVVVVQFLGVPLEECIRRDRARPRSVGERVIRGMHATYVAPGGS